MRKSVKERFWEKVEKIPGGCWLWRGSLDKDGYGCLWSGGRLIWVHRLSWSMFHNEEIPEGGVIRRKCGNKNCVYPRHLKLERRDKDSEKRFWSKVDKKGKDECWEWVAARLQTGYGEFRWNGKPINAHRLAWELHNGRKIPEGLLVMHTCDNRGCCNPHHLRLGTDADNIRDAAKKGRMRHGEDHPFSKLTEPQVILIRKVSPLTSANLIAEVYGISLGYVYQIIRGDQWKHLQETEPA